MTRHVDESPRSDTAVHVNKLVPRQPAGRSTPQRSARSQIPALELLPAAQRTGLLTSLQRQLGNRSVQRMLSAQGPTKVQRACGDSSPCGCASCTGEEDRDDESHGTAAVQRAIAIQRQEPSEGPSPELPPGSRYSHLDPDLLKVLGETLKQKTYWVWANANPQPKDLGGALDMLTPALVNALVQVKKGLDRHKAWGSIKTIKTIWATSSQGIAYNGPPMLGLVSTNKSFCQDTIGGELMHKGRCWREIVKPPGSPGLHYCSGELDQVHIDPHQVAEGHKTVLEISGDEWPTLREGVYCDYHGKQVLKHWGDLFSERPNPLHQHQELVREVKHLKTRASKDAMPPNARDQIPALDKLKARLDVLDENTLRDWSVKGFEGDEGEGTKKVVKELDAIGGEVSGIRAIINHAETLDPRGNPKWPTVT